MTFWILRSEALVEIKKDLYYESMYDRTPTEEAEFKNKWKIKKVGESPYFFRNDRYYKNMGRR